MSPNRFVSLSKATRYSTQTGLTYGRKIDEIMGDLAGIKLENLSDEAIAGLERVIKELRSGQANKVKGAAHHVHVLRHFSELGKVKKVEVLEDALSVSGEKIIGRRYDAVIEINGVDTIIEAKSWLPDNIESLTRSYLRGKPVKVNGKATDEYLGEGAQLMVDLINYSKKGFVGHKWVFDKGMEGNVQRFKDELIDTIESNDVVRQNLIKHLKLTGNDLDAALDSWLDNELLKNLDTFIVVL